MVLSVELMCYCNDVEQASHLYLAFHSSHLRIDSEKDLRQGMSLRMLTSESLQSSSEDLDSLLCCRVYVAT